MTEDILERITVLETQMKQVQDFARTCHRERSGTENQLVREIQTVRRDMERLLGGLSMIKWGVGILVAAVSVIAAFMALGK